MNTADMYFRLAIDFIDRFLTAGDNAVFKLSCDLVRKSEDDEVAGSKSSCQRYCDSWCDHLRFSRTSARKEVQVRNAVADTVLLSFGWIHRLRVNGPTSGT